MLAAVSPDERDRFLRALTFFSAPKLVDETLALSLGKDVRTQDAARLITTSMSHPWSRRAAWTFVKTRWPELVAKVPENMLTRVVGSVGSFCDADLLHDGLAFFADKKLPGIKRRLAQVKEDGEQCIAWKARESAPLSAWLHARGKKHASR